MTADDDFCIELVVPIFRLLCAAPERESRDLEELNEVLSQRPVSDND